MADTRHDDLLAELDKRGWLGGVWTHHLDHRSHHFHGGLGYGADEIPIGGLAFGEHGNGLAPRVLITVHPAPHKPPRSFMRRVVERDARGQRAWATVRRDVPGVVGAGYVVRLHAPGGDKELTASTAAGAADLMRGHLDALAPEHRAVFDAAHARPPQGRKRA